MTYLIRIVVVAIALFTMFPVKGFRPNSYAEQNSIIKLPDRGEVLGVFKEAIELNEDFKKTVGKISLDEHKKKRRKLEKFNEEVLRLKIKDCVKLLSSGSDTNLAVEFLRLLISYENSADERLSFALGEVFLHNPDVAIETFDKFKKPDQQYLYEKLEWGWRNAIYGKDISKPIIEDRTRRLKELGLRFLESTTNSRTGISESEDYPAINNSNVIPAANKAKSKKSNWYYNPLMLVLLSGLVAAILTLLINILYHAHLRKKARRSLIIAFATELVLAFHRCIIYYRQKLTERLEKVEVSYSELFEFADASMLSNFLL